MSLYVPTAPLLPQSSYTLSSLISGDADRTGSAATHLWRSDLQRECKHYSRWPDRRGLNMNVTWMCVSYSVFAFMMRSHIVPWWFSSMVRQKAWPNWTSPSMGWTCTNVRWVWSSTWKRSGLMVLWERKVDGVSYVNRSVNVTLGHKNVCMWGCLRVCECAHLLRVMMRRSLKRKM